MSLLNKRTIAFVFGFVFIAIAILGFIPNPLVSERGMFEVNMAHNLTHLITGLVFLSGPYFFKKREEIVINLMAVLYLPIAILGFFVHDQMLLGFIHINEADKYLHVLVALTFIMAALIARENKIYDA